ncbi:hypothetical protein [Mycobacterium sp. DL592]|uniref:hypothetical protein n=1 Tax=Mycobacterium sp. DL592 TaxID=2675524 RepID=UPI0014246DB8|nr:hypothetical protein [Mycobacterium sp. DL592]
MTASNATETDSGSAHRRRLWVNWLLALSTILGAAAVPLLAMGAVMNTAACGEPDCPKPTGFVYGLLIYTPAVVVVVAILLSFFTAGHRRGFGVPVLAWLVIVVDVAVLVATFSS